MTPNHVLDVRNVFARNPSELIDEADAARVEEASQAFADGAYV
jgi:hypothetical protein